MPSVLGGKPLRYLIGSNGPFVGQIGEIIEVPYSTETPPPVGQSIAYCNLRREDGEPPEYGPYLPHDDIFRDYGEGAPDPAGPGWEKNAREQCVKRRDGGFSVIEWDNLDTYDAPSRMRALAIAEEYGLQVAVKNPGLLSNGTQIVAHPNSVCIIVEAGAGSASQMDVMRRLVGKDDLPVFFVFFGTGRAEANQVAADIRSRGYQNMSVTFDRAGDEYGGQVEDIQLPIVAKKFPSVFEPSASIPDMRPSMPDEVPPWLQNIRADEGLEEIAGPANNPKIIAKTFDIAARFPSVQGFRQYCAEYNDDSKQAWCGLEAGDAVSKAGYMPPFNPADELKSFYWAAAWRTWGAPSEPRVGAIVCFDRHVAFINRIIDADTYEVIGGNQSSAQGGAVTRSRRGADEVLAIRWPSAATAQTSVAPSTVGLQSGKGSWYSQYSGKYEWVDSGDKPNSAALGCPDDAQGISFYNNATLGKWFEVHYPNGFVSIEQQTDIGPNPNTGRKIDVSAAAAERAGYTPRNFPTDAIISWRSIPAPSIVAGLPPVQQATVYRDRRSEKPMAEVFPPGQQLPGQAPPQIDWNAILQQAVQAAIQAALPSIIGAVQQRLGQPLQLPAPVNLPPMDTPTTPAPATVGSAIGFVAQAASKVLPMLGLQGSVAGTALLWGLQALDIVGTAGGATATPTGGVASAGLAGVGLSSIVALIGRFLNKK